MPKCLEVLGYILFFWSNEGDPLEPVHVHVGKRIGPNCTKVWILSDDSAQVANNNSKIPVRDLRRICRVIEAYADDLVAQWQDYFGITPSFIDQSRNQ